MDELDLKKVDKILAKQLAAVGKVRDKLDDDIGTLQELKSGCNEAWEALQYARDALSRLV